MKKICFVTTVSITINAFILELAKYMHSTGEFDISMICSPDPELEAKLPSYIHYFPVKMDRGISLTGFSALSEMKKIFKREKFDIVQYSTPNAACYASIAAKQSRVPVRLYCQWGIAYVGFQGMKRRVFKMVEKMVCRNSTDIRPDSFGNLKFSISEGLYTEKKGKVILHGSACGVPLTKFDITKKEEYRQKIRARYGIPDDAFVYGFVGRITGDKGINELFYATDKILSEDEKAYLLAVGAPEKEESIDSQLYQRAQEHPRVIFAGATNVVEQYLSAMDCYILPSYREGFGMVVVEAESMGVPVIVTDIPGPTDAMIEKETGLIVKKKDTDTLISAMKYLRENPDITKSFGDAAYKFAVENFEQKKLFDAIITDRKEMMAKKP